MAEVETQKDLDFERKHEEDLRRIRDFRLMDDNFMSKVFEDKPCAEFLLRIILNRDDFNDTATTEIYTLSLHDALPILQGRSVRLDILAVDHENRAYNVEVQRSDSGAVAKRARYNSGLLDANLTRKGDAYDALNETYVIFITEKDVLRGGLPIYHINRIIEETGKSFGDDAHIIYVNSQIKDETALGKLMHDFTCTDPDDMNYPLLAQRVRYFKEDTKGVTTMCKAMEEMRAEERKEATYAKAIAVAQKMLKAGIPYEEIADMVELSVDEVKALDTKKPA